MPRPFLAKLFCNTDYATPSPRNRFGRRWKNMPFEKLDSNQAAQRTSNDSLAGAPLHEDAYKDLSDGMAAIARVQRFTPPAPTDAASLARASEVDAIKAQLKARDQEFHVRDGAIDFAKSIPGLLTFGATMFQARPAAAGILAAGAFEQEHGWASTERSANRTISTLQTQFVIPESTMESTRLSCKDDRGGTMAGITLYGGAGGWIGYKYGGKIGAVVGAAAGALEGFIYGRGWESARRRDCEARALEKAVRTDLSIQSKDPG
jgi:hypothetical protein